MREWVWQWTGCPVISFDGSEVDLSTDKWYYTDLSGATVGPYNDFEMASLEWKEYFVANRKT